MKIFIPQPIKTKEHASNADSGASLSVYNHMQALAEHCDVYVTADEPTEYQENLYGIPTDFGTIETALKWFEAQEFDNILMFDPNIDNLSFFRHVCPAPIVIRLACCFGHNRDFFDRALSCYSLLRPYDALAPKSRWCAEQMRDYVYDSSYLKPITNGIDTQIFQPFDKQEARRVLANMTDDSRFLDMPLVGACSRVEPGKGIYPLLRVADDHPDILFVIVGQVYGQISHPLNVIFLGAQPYDFMPTFYNAMDMVCALSVYAYESCPSVVLEGMACGLPVIATRFAGAPELLSDCGYIVEIDRFENEPLNIAGYIDPNSVSDQIGALLDNTAQCETLGKAARDRAKEFSWDNIAQEHILLFKELQEKRETVAPPIPVTPHFTQQSNVSGSMRSVSRVYNFIGGQQGPFPSIPFLHQDLPFLDGLALYLSHVLHPNEVEAALLGITQDRAVCHSLLKKTEQLREMLTAP